MTEWHGRPYPWKKAKDSDEVLEWGAKIDDAEVAEIGDTVVVARKKGVPTKSTIVDIYRFEDGNVKVRLESERQNAAPAGNGGNGLGDRIDAMARAFKGMERDINHLRKRVEAMEKDMEF